MSKRQKLVLPGAVFHKLFPAFTKIQQIVLWNFFHKLWKTGCKTGLEERKNGAAGRFFTLSTGFSTTHRQKFPVYGAYNGARDARWRRLDEVFVQKYPIREARAALPLAFAQRPGIQFTRCAPNFSERAKGIEKAGAVCYTVN
ncbi:MAG TPA: hypothetical protein H9883_00485 [Candidatus Ruthenibacterium merdigallinarum]|nr:hypothetical protein [Candidatus Ruthenibacterium merdigallinarum]